MSMPRHFVDLWKLEAADLRAILDDAHARKAARKGWPQGRIDADAPAKDRVLAMIFQKNSTRTRFSFDAAIRQLGGSGIISTGADMQLGRGETIEEHRGRLEGKTLAWVGDGNNVCASFIHAAPKLGYELKIACPAVYHPDLMDLARAAEHQGHVSMMHDAHEAVAGADVVVTDTWVSMGDTDHDERVEAFEPFQVDEALMGEAASGAAFLHCLPAHRGEEVTDAVIDGPQSLVWDEAENRIHAQKSILAWCFGAVG